MHFFFSINLITGVTIVTIIGKNDLVPDNKKIHICTTDYAVC